VPQKMVRTDAAEKKLEYYFAKDITTSQSQSQSPSQGGASSQEGGRLMSPTSQSPPILSQGLQVIANARRQSPKRKKVVLLTSVQQLISEIDQECDPVLADIMRAHTYVGQLNEHLCLLQHKTQMYLVNLHVLSKAFFYERIIRKFSNLSRIQLCPGAPVRQLLLLALDHPEGGWEASHGPKADIAENQAQFLLSKGPMLSEYFALDFSRDGEGQVVLETIPDVVGGYVPPLAMLPLFLLRLALECNWDSEKECFQSVAQELAKFYQIQFSDVYRLTHARETEGEAKHSSSSSSAAAAVSVVTDAEADPTPPLVSQSASPSSATPELAQPSGNAPVSNSLCIASMDWLIPHAILPAFRASFSPPRATATNGCFTRIADLQKLYKIFERC
jgi:DNA mismatch repair protein MLH1